MAWAYIIISLDGCQSAVENELMCLDCLNKLPGLSAFLCAPRMRSDPEKRGQIHFSSALLGRPAHAFGTGTADGELVVCERAELNLSPNDYARRLKQAACPEASWRRFLGDRFTRTCNQ